MKDRYYLTSLAATLCVFAVVLLAVFGFIYVTGIMGVAAVVFAAALFLCIFYDVSGKKGKSGRREI